MSYSTQKEQHEQHDENELNSCIYSVNNNNNNINTNINIHNSEDLNKLVNQYDSILSNIAELDINDVGYTSIPYLPYLPEKIIQEFTYEKDIYNKYIDEIKNNSDKYKSQLEMIKTYEDMSILKLGHLDCHISDYIDKIHNSVLDEITINRIQDIIKIYQDINSYLITIV